jgi:hypothetical protein
VSFYLHQQKYRFLLSVVLPGRNFFCDRGVGALNCLNIKMLKGGWRVVIGELVTKIIVACGQQIANNAYICRLIAKQKTMYKGFLILALVLSVAASECCAQGGGKGGVSPEDRQVDMDNPTFVPTVKIGKVEFEGDSIQYVETSNIYVFPQPEFKNAKQRNEYNRLVYNVKKVLPMAKEVNHLII